MIFEEFFWLECGLELKRAKARLNPGIAFDPKRARERIIQMLPFKPTGAQKRVLGEIAQDMAEPHPMYRLLQGDVGSGKTLVAAEAAIIAVENGYQAAVLAPTEILATQHYFYFKKLFQKLNYVTVLLTGSNTQREKAQLKKLVAAGLVQIVVGTHALLEADVEFQKLGLAIVDEQHRFGVEQRQKLMEKGSHPDVLVMTATPIPRTLALTVYGDLDVSVIDEMPPGRKPIVTKHVEQTRIEQVYSFLKQQVDAGRQAYVVYPVIEESETQAMKAAEKMHDHLSRLVYPGLAVGLLHGKLTPHEKEIAMEKFQRGETQILVATTVIEVGVDVPNATVMLIEQAERFGLAQMHQLRGRVGRGAEQSYCILVTDKLNPDVAGTHPHHGGIERRLLHRGDGHEAARARGILWHETIRAARAADRQHLARCGYSGSGPQRSRGVRGASAGGRRSAPGGRLHSRSLAAALRFGSGGLNGNGLTSTTGVRLR